MLNTPTTFGRQGLRVIGCCLSLFFPLISSEGAPVVIGDASFEGNSLGPSGYHYNLGPEWEETGGTGNTNGFEEYIVGFVADGTDHLGMQGGHDVWQDLGVTYQADTRYTLSVALGNRIGNTFAGNLSTYALAGDGGAVFASAAFDASTIAPQSFQDAPVLVFDTASNPGAIGQPIRILLQARGAGRSHFDHIRLEAVELQPSGAAVVEALPATEIAVTAATLNVTVTDIGDGAPSLVFYYGTSDGGVVPGAWDEAVTLSGTHAGPVSVGIAGLEPASVYYFTARATNASGEGWALPAQSFETLAMPPVVANLPPTGMTATTVTLGAEVLSTGGDNPEVVVHYGPADGGSDAGAWEGSVSLGSVSTQQAVEVAGLTPGTTYYFRAEGVNSGGSGWAGSSLSFSTTVVALPVVSNRGPNGVTGTTASLRGEVDATGGDTPHITMFYGPADGGTTPESWAASVDVGLQDGGFSAFVAGLEPDTNYWFRCRARNAAGTVWAEDSNFFKTTGLLPGGPIFNEIHFDPRDESTPGEFIEIHNPGDGEIDLSGWSVTNGVEYTFGSGTILAAGAYLVVAQDPDTMLAIYGVTAHGPWVGRLDNDGEELELRDQFGEVRDEVSFSAGFPWPTGARGGGGSAELVHPSLDNDLGGSWRLSIGDYEPSSTLVTAADSGWRYRKGTSEASDPVGDWRLPSFVEDGSWATGRTPVGYGDGDDNTVLSDMRNNYTTVYLRKEFTLPPGDIPSRLTLRLYVDDGAVVWINGTEVARRHAPAGELAHDATGFNHEASWEEVEVNNAELFLVGGTNVLAIHGLNANLPSSDFSIDAALVDPGVPAGSAVPSPGARNRSHAAVAPPQIRQVDHSPEVPQSGQEVVITAKITDPDGVGPVSLSYQTVDPGAYIRRTDPAYSTDWTDLPMVDDGTGLDAAAGDSIFTVVVPGAVQADRRLVRYRITFEDTAGERATVPWPDDEQPNFAYFVHDGLPSWTGSFTPGGPVSTFSPAVMNDLPAYHLIANQADVLNSQYSSGSNGVHMLGTLVYGGDVYDHIEFENRGEASTYVSGKNKWRLHFNRARAFEARDNRGKRYASGWNKMNLEGCSSPWAAVHRGMAGVEEALSYRLYELCGVPSPRTHYLHFRVVDNAVEADPSSQYEGDLWGLYLAVEQPNGSFLNDRGLPDGNVYKIQGGSGNKKEQGLGQPVDSSDWNTFYADSNSTQDAQWWREHMDMDAYYSMRACNRICGNVDIRLGYNHYFYHHPDGRWVPMPWDLDMMFIAETHQAGYIRQQNSLNNGELALEFRNRCRELLDLMCSDGSPDGGQIGQLIDEYAQIVNPAGQELTWADLDAFMWNYHPRTSGNPDNHGGQSSHKGNFFHTPYGDSRIGGSWTRTLASSDHEGSMAYLREYATDEFGDGEWTLGNGVQQGYGYEYLKLEALDNAIPGKPVAGFTGMAGFPVDDLRFGSTAFTDPEGEASFGGMQWRLAEIASPGRPGFVDGDERRYEVEALWESGELDVFVPEIQVPVAVARPGHSYRLRVRHKDATGRWSHWSDPVEFVAGAADVAVWQDHLVISEIMYHPPEPVGADELDVTNDKDDFEYIELWNASEALTLDLSDLRFTKGVDFDFAGSAVTSLGPGEFVLVVRNLPAFEARYGVGLPVAGEYSGGLSNDGEQIKLSYGAGFTVRDFTYDDLAPWPSGADGWGPALVLIDPEVVPDHAEAANWRAAWAVGGTPGAQESPEPGSFDAWREDQFSPEQLEDPLVSGPEADPDGDERSNFLEWALASDPLAVDVPVLEFAWADDGGATYPAVRFRKPEGAVGVAYELLAGDGLEDWEVVATGALSEESLGGGIEQALLRDSETADASRRYLRIRVSVSD